MNQVIEAINKRRSIRAYAPKPIPRDVMNTIIEAGNQAPSTMGMVKGVLRFQPWRFVVVENPEFKQKLFQTIEPLRSNFYQGLKKTVPEMYEQAMKLSEMSEEPKDLIFYSAPVIIYVIGPARNSIGCAMVCENIMLAAVSLGLGSCYVGFGSLVKQDADVVKILELKDGERIYGPIVLGYPKVDPSERQVSTLAELRPKKNEPMIKWV